MLKITIEVKETVRNGSAAMCGCAVNVEGASSRPELLAASNGLARCMATLVKSAPDLSGALYDYFADSLKKELGAENK